MTDRRIPPEKLEAWRSLLEVHSALMRRLEDELNEEIGLPLTWFDVLYQLAQAPEGQLRMQELAQRLLISRSGFTRMSDRMEAAGLVERKPCPTDRRGIFVVLTDEGRRILQAATPVHLRGIGEHFADHLDGPTARSLSTALDNVIAVLRPRD